MFGNKKKNQPIRIHSIGQEAKEPRPEDGNQQKITDLFNELLKRPDYKKFDYGQDVLRTPHEKNIDCPDVKATYYKQVKTDLYHYGTDPITGCSIDENLIVTRFITTFEGKEVKREYKFNDKIKVLASVPRPDLTRIEQAAKAISDQKQRQAKLARAKSAVEGEKIDRENNAIAYLRNQGFSFNTNASLEELERTVEQLKMSK